MQPRTLSAIRMRHMIDALAEAMTTLRAVPTNLRLEHKIPEATGKLVYVWDCLLDATVSDVEVEAAPVRVVKFIPAMETV